jgi:hypothetical protein
MRRRFAFLILILFGGALGVGAALLVRRALPGGCRPAPGEWYAQVKALLRDYREPCASFYWLPGPGDEFHLLVKFNNYGLHGPDATLDKPPGVYRVLVVGDSFPQGMQVETEQTFSYRLQELLNKPSGQKIDVINLSVDAYGTDRELLLYALFGARFRPDLVLLSFYVGNDLQDNQIDLEERRYGYRLNRPFFTLGGGALQLHNALAMTPNDTAASRWLASLTAAQSPAPSANLPERPRVTEQQPYTLEYPVELGLYLPENAHWRDAWTLTEALVVQFRALAQMDGAAFAVTLIPDRRAVQDSDWAATLQAYGNILPELRQADPTAPGTRLENFLKANQIPALNLTWGLRSWAASHPDGRLYYAGDGHFNADGHALAADRLAGWLRSALKVGTS